MTEEAKKLLSTFEARLRHLIYLHDELKRENAELKQLLEEEKKENERILAEYKSLEPEKLIAMVAYQFSQENLKLRQRNDTGPYTEKIEELTEMLEEYFKGEWKHVLSTNL